MLELNYDSDGKLESFDFYEDSLYEDLDSIPDWVNPRSPVRTLEDHGRSNQADEEMRLQA